MASSTPVSSRMQRSGQESYLAVKQRYNRTTHDDHVNFNFDDTPWYKTDGMIVYMAFVITRNSIVRLRIRLGASKIANMRIHKGWVNLCLELKVFTNLCLAY